MPKLPLYAEHAEHAEYGILPSFPVLKLGGIMRNMELGGVKVRANFQKKHPEYRRDQILADVPFRWYTCVSADHAG